MARRQPRADQKIPALDSASPAVDAQTLAEIQRAQRIGLQYLGPDPWPLLRDLVFTVDEIDGQVKKFPAKPYLEHMARTWIREKLLAIMKSRRMMQTWEVCALNYWLGRTQPNSLICFAARKEGKTEHEGSAGLIHRMKQIHEHLLPVLPPIAFEYRFCRIELGNGSTFLGIGEGPDQMRQLTCTSLVADEFAHWQWPYESFQAMQPTALGGGRVTVLSSAGLGFFADLVFDRFKNL